MIGGKGSDVYLVDNIGDQVMENANEGIDTVYSTINYALTANVENLILGGQAITGTGNELDNELTGNSLNNTLTGGAGSDWLDGGTGADTMNGGTGDDAFVVDNTGDLVVENLSEGNDTVLSSITYTLGANVESLYLTGTANINGTGNSLDNVLLGNNCNNILNGGAGNDILEGGLGDDTYLFGVGSGNDMINSYIGVNTDNGLDTLQFQNLALSSILFTKNANDLICTISQTSETVRLSNWLLGANYQVDQFQFSDGTLSSTQISQKIA